MGEGFEEVAKEDFFPGVGHILFGKVSYSMTSVTHNPQQLAIYNCIIIVGNYSKHSY